MAQTLHVKWGFYSTWDHLCPGEQGVCLYFMTAVSALHAFILMCLPPASPFSTLLGGARGTAGLTECPLSSCPMVYEAIEKKGMCRAEWQSWVEQDGASQGTWLGRYPLAARCTTGCVYWCPMCPFKCSNTQGLLQWDARISRDSYTGMQECLHIVTVALKSSSSTLQCSDTLPPFQHTAFYHWAAPEAQAVWLWASSDLSDTSINLGCWSQLVWKYLKSAYTASVPSLKGAYALGWQNSRTKAMSMWCAHLLISILWHSASTASMLSLLPPQ